MFASKDAKMALPLSRAVKAQNMLQMSRVAMSGQASIMQMQARNFASFDQIEKATQKLDKALEGEIKYENENYTQLEDIETFLTESGFKFEETDGGLQMKLIKEVGNHVVEVHFESR